MTHHPATYWEERALRYATHGNGLRAVCSFGMPMLYNRTIHWTQQRALSDLLTDVHGMDVLDVGCGIGRWSIRMAAAGARVVGLDLSRTMTEAAYRRSIEAGVTCEFLTGSAADLRLERQFNRILCVTVLQHLNDAELRRTLANFHHMLAPGGTIVLMEVAPDTPRSDCDTDVFTSRTLDDYQSAFAAAGLFLEEQRGVDIVPVKQTLLPRLRHWPDWFGRAALIAGSLLALPIDWLFARANPRASWHKVLLLRKIEDRA